MGSPFKDLLSKGKAAIVDSERRAFSDKADRVCKGVEKYRVETQLSREECYSSSRNNFRKSVTGNEKRAGLISDPILKRLLANSAPVLTNSRLMRTARAKLPRGYPGNRVHKDDRYDGGSIGRNDRQFFVPSNDKAQNYRDDLSDKRSGGALFKLEGAFSEFYQAMDHKERW